MNKPLLKIDAPMVKPKIKPAKKPLIIFFVLILCIVSRPASGQEKAYNAASPKVLRFATVFESMPGVDIEDVRLTLQIILSKAAALKNNFYNAEMDFIPDYTKAVDKILNGNYHFVIATGTDFANLNQTIPMTPLLILSKLDQPSEPLLLVTRKGKTLAEISRQPKVTLLLDEGRLGAMSRIWLDTVLMESGLAASRSFFSEISYSRKASRILLPVFFGKADACVIPKSTFDLLADLNPQISQTLTIQRQSEDLVFWLASATPLATPEDRQILADKRKWLTNDPDVQQAITLVQMKQFFLFEDSIFKATGDLFKRYERLTTLKRNSGGEAAQ